MKKLLVLTVLTTLFCGCNSQTAQKSEPQGKTQQDSENCKQPCCKKRCETRSCHKSCPCDDSHPCKK